MRQQAGMTLLSNVIVLAFAGLLIKAAFSLVPLFWEDRLLDTVLKKIDETEQYRNLNASEYEHLLAEMLQRNHLAIPIDALHVRPVAGGLELEWNYERRAKWIANIDFSVQFKHHKEIN